MLPVVKALLEEGLPVKLVAGKVGISYPTFKSWYEQGEAEDCKDELLVAFARTVAEARATAAQLGVKLLKQHAVVDWKAAHALLKAQDPDIWGEKRELKVDAKVETKNADDLAQFLSDEELELAKKVAAAARERKEKGKGLTR